MIGLLYIWIGVAIAGIMIVLAICYEHKLFGIILFVFWPFALPIYYIVKEYNK